MSPFLLTAILAFVTIAGLGFAFVGGGSSGSSAAAKRAKTILEPKRMETAKSRDRDPAARRKQILKSLKDQEKKQRKATVALSAKLFQAGLTISVRAFWLMSLGLGVVVFLFAFLFTQKLWLGLLLGFGLGLMIPRTVVGMLGKKRSAKFVAAFPDAADIIVRGIRSGLPVHDCLKIIAKEAPQPLSGEFRRLVENLGMGVSMDQALNKMYERMPIAELRFFAIVLSIQQKTGGNLAEALGNLSGVLRARKMMREKIKAMSGEATASAGIIGSMPPAVIVLLSLINPSYIGLLFSDPRGNLMLLVGVFWMSVGIFVMRRMINFKF